MNPLRDRWANWNPECLSDHAKEEVIASRFLTSRHTFAPFSRLGLKRVFVSPVDSSTVTLRTRNLSAHSSYCTASVPSSLGPLKASPASCWPLLEADTRPATSSKRVDTWSSIHREPRMGQGWGQFDTKPRGRARQGVIALPELTNWSLSAISSPGSPLLQDMPGISKGTWKYSYYMLNQYFFSDRCLIIQNDLRNPFWLKIRQVHNIHLFLFHLLSSQRHLNSKPQVLNICPR